MTDAALPPDPRIARQHAMATYLRVGLMVSFLLGLGALVAPVGIRHDLGAAMVVVLVLVPIGRVAWLMVRWLRRGDRRFATAAAVLLLVMAGGVVVAH
jgi:hypothetical protein